MNLEALKESLKNHEGVKRFPYRDTEEKLTIGVGHLLDAEMPPKLIDLILEFDISVAVEELDRVFPSWRTHSEARQTVLVELCFNLGAPRLKEFTKFWFAMQQQNYDEASRQLLDSKWAKQVKGRADTLTRRLREDSLT